MTHQKDRRDGLWLAWGHHSYRVPPRRSVERLRDEDYWRMTAGYVETWQLTRGATWRNGWGEEIEMKLSDFIAQLAPLPAAFHANYLAGVESNPEDWPTNMPAVEWHEQFVVWLESQEFGE